MRVLVTGAAGSLGRAVCAALAQEEVEFLPSDRDLSAVRALYRGRAILPLDFVDACDPADWMLPLRGVDAVINTAGIYREDQQTSYDAVHTWAPRALFSAACLTGVRRLIQVSALGANRAASHRALITKTWADDDLARLAPNGQPLDWCVVQPSLLVSEHARPARGDKSARCDLGAHWPLLRRRPSHVRATLERRVQPMPVIEAGAILARLLLSPSALPRRLPLVGRRVKRFRDAVSGIPVQRLRDLSILIERDAVADPSAMRAVTGQAPRGSQLSYHAAGVHEPIQAMP